MDHTHIFGQKSQAECGLSQFSIDSMLICMEGCFQPFWPFSGGYHFPEAAFALFSAVLTIFGQLHFIIFRRLGNFQPAVNSFASAVVAIFGWLPYYCF